MLLEFYQNLINAFPCQRSTSATKWYCCEFWGITKINATNFECLQSVFTLWFDSSIGVIQLFF